MTMTLPTPNLDTKTFWQYSVSRYALKDIAPLALLLQDNHKVNVNVLLLVCWCLENNVIINLTQLNAVITASGKWDEKLNAHRAKRKAAHPNVGGDKQCYEALKAQELDLEREQQAEMVAAFNQLNVTRLPKGAEGQPSQLFNASIAALINAYELRENDEARRLVSLLVHQLA